MPSVERQSNLVGRQTDDTLFETIHLDRFGISPTAARVIVHSMVVSSRIPNTGKHPNFEPVRPAFFYITPKTSVRWPE